jgi:hypothetical protein
MGDENMVTVTKRLSKMILDILRFLSLHVHRVFVGKYFKMERCFPWLPLSQGDLRCWIGHDLEIHVDIGRSFLVLVGQCQVVLSD